MGETKHMKTVLLLRHAAAANDPDDKKRPLTIHGWHQATSIGRWLAKHFVAVDAIFSSSAKRARQTAELLAEVADLDLEVFLSDDLYDVDAGAYLEAIRGLDGIQHGQAAQLIELPSPGTGSMAPLRDIQERKTNSECSTFFLGQISIID